VRTIFHAWTEAGSEIDLDNPPTVWGQIEKFDLDVPFWQMVKATFGYEEENPTLKNFLLRLMLTDYAHHLKGEVPQSIRGLLLPRTGWSNAVVCLAQWRDSSSKASSYDRLSGEAAAILKMEDHLPDLEIDQLLDVMTFLASRNGSPAACVSGSRRPPTRSMLTMCEPSLRAGSPAIGPRCL
jgi:hypothetical protein